jgi:formylglycine-generating enzyme required for sulfatase activity
VAAALAAAIGVGFGSGCVAVLGDFGDKDIPEPDGGAAGAGTGGMAGAGGAGGQAGGMGGAGTGGMGGMGGEATGGAGGMGGSPQVSCPATGKGPAMVLIPGPNGVDYCIDATEVSVEHYDAWLSDAPSVDGQASECDAWNTTFMPSTDDNNFCNYYNYPNFVMNYAKSPIRCVDWCDAAAFCKWAGKRLCGAIGGGPGSSNKPTDPNENEWYRACSEAGMREYPYGDAYNNKACIGIDYDGSTMFDPAKDFPHDVGSTDSCQGGYLGLLDMSGNIEEWEGSCNGSNGNGDACLTRGGSYVETAGDLACSRNVAPTRDTAAITIGFRCCADSL